MSNVAVMANAYSPMPSIRPIAAVTQRLAAVVIPTTFSCPASTAPAPMKLIPATIPAAI